MGDYTSSMQECMAVYNDLNQALDKAQAYREKLQSELDEKSQTTAKLRAQVDAQRAQEQVKEEQEQLVLQEIKQLNKDLEAAKEHLEEEKHRNKELRQLRQAKVNEFEAAMRELCSEFNLLRLLKEGENSGSEDIAKKLEEEVAELEKECIALTTSDINSDLPLNTLSSLLSESSVYLEKIKERVRKTKDKEMALKKEMKSLQQKKDGSAPQ